MSALNHILVHLGKLRLLNSIDDKPLSQLTDLTCAFHAESQSGFISKDWRYKFDKNGNVVFYSMVPLVDLQREFEQDDYVFEFTIRAPGYQTQITQLMVSSETFNTLSAQVEQLIDGQTPDDAMGLLFDQTIKLSPKPAVAQASLSSMLQSELNPQNYILEIVSPSVLTGQAIGSLAIWSFNPLPVADEVTLQVRSSSDDSTVAEVDLTIDYSKPITIWDVPINV